MMLKKIVHSVLVGNIVSVLKGNNQQTENINKNHEQGRRRDGKTLSDFHKLLDSPSKVSPIPLWNTERNARWMHRSPFCAPALLKIFLKITKCIRKFCITQETKQKYLEKHCAKKSSFTTASEINWRYGIDLKKSYNTACAIYLHIASHCALERSLFWGTGDIPDIEVSLPAKYWGLICGLIHC